MQEYYIKEFVQKKLYMSYKKLTVRRSKIEGYGLYANEFIRKGEIVMFWMANAYLIKEIDYNARQLLGDKQMIATGARYVGDMFLYTDVGPNQDRYENYINHSFNPNILYHCGVCFALRDIQINEELTTDYTYLLSENDQETFLDEFSSKEVKGASWKECLLHTTEQLHKLLVSCANDRYESKEKVSETLEVHISEKNKLELYTTASPTNSDDQDSQESCIHPNPLDY